MALLFLRTMLLTKKHHSTTITIQGAYSTHISLNPFYKGCANFNF